MYTYSQVVANIFVHATLSMLISTMPACTYKCSTVYLSPTCWRAVEFSSEQLFANLSHAPPAPLNKH